MMKFLIPYTIEDAVCNLVAAFQAGKIPNSTTDIRKHNRDH